MAGPIAGVALFGTRQNVSVFRKVPAAHANPQYRERQDHLLQSSRAEEPPEPGSRPSGLKPRQHRSPSRETRSYQIAMRRVRCMSQNSQSVQIAD